MVIANILDHRLCVMAVTQFFGNTLHKKIRTTKRPSETFLQMVPWQPHLPPKTEIKLAKMLTIL